MRTICQRCGGTSPAVTRSLGICADCIRRGFASVSPRMKELRRVRIANVHLLGGDRPPV